MSFLKKILTLAACACLLVSVCSCDKENKELKPFKKAIENTAPASAVLHSELATELGVLSADYNASYSDGAIAVSYTKDALSEVTPDTDEDELFYTYEGEATVDKDGKVTSGELGSLVRAILALDINLDGNISTYSAGDNQDSLEFTVSENTESVFGVDVGYPVSVKLEVLDGRVVSCFVEYVSDSGRVTVSCDFVF